MNTILKPIFKIYIKIRDIEPKKQLVIFTFLLGVWIGADYLFSHGIIKF